MMNDVSLVHQKNLVRLVPFEANSVPSVAFCVSGLKYLVRISINLMQGKIFQTGLKLSHF